LTLGGVLAETRGSVWWWILYILGRLENIEIWFGVLLDLDMLSEKQNKYPKSKK